MRHWCLLHGKYNQGIIIFTLSRNTLWKQASSVMETELSYYHFLAMMSAFQVNHWIYIFCFFSKAQKCSTASRQQQVPCSAHRRNPAKPVNTFRFFQTKEDTNVCVPWSNSLEEQTLSSQNPSQHSSLLQQPRQAKNFWLRKHLAGAGLCPWMVPSVQTSSNLLKLPELVLE